MKKIICFSLAFAVFFTFAAYSASAGILVVVNKGVAESSISKEELKRIYLGKQTRWGNGDKIKFSLLKTKIIKDFTKKYLGLSIKSYFKYWKKIVFTGKGTMPPFYDKEDDMVAFVANTKGAIGFVPSDFDTDGVKVINIE